MYRMKARVEIEGRVWGKEGKSLSSLQLHEEVEGAVVVCVGHYSCPSDPQIDLHVIKTHSTVKNEIPRGRSTIM